MVGACLRFGHGSVAEIGGSLGLAVSQSSPSVSSCLKNCGREQLKKMPDAGL